MEFEVLEEGRFVESSTSWLNGRARHERTAVAGREWFNGSHRPVGHRIPRNARGRADSGGCHPDVPSSSPPAPSALPKGLSRARVLKRASPCARAICPRAQDTARLVQIGESVWSIRRSRELRQVVDFGAHLPLMDFGNHPYTLEHLVSYTQMAARLGFSALAVNDHMVFAVPWLDGPIALAAVMEHSGEMTLATTVSLAVVRGPVPVAKTLAAIDRLSGGRLVVAVGPGSSPDDYAAVGLEFSERWQRFDEAIGALRALWRADDTPFVGLFYSTDGLVLEPLPARPGGPPIWIGAGDPTRGFDASPASPTDGLRPRTTRRRSCSLTRGTRSA